MSTLAPNKLPSPAEYSGLNRHRFERLVNESYEPFVIRGVASDWPIVKESSEACSYLRSEATNSKTLDQKLKLTRVPRSSNRKMFYKEDMRGMNFGTAELSLQNCLLRMSRKVDDADYAVQSAPLKKYFPTIASEHLTDLLDHSIEPLIWFGNGLTITPHFDEADNLAVVGSGKRRFTLFPPQQITNLYIGPLDHTPAGQPVSLVDVNKPDLTRFPNYIHAYEQALSVELGPGDAIFIPTPWWHHVDALSEFNVLINYWWSDRRVSTSSPFLALLHAIQSLNTMEKNRKEAWKAYLFHYLGDPKAIRSHIPKHSQGVLGDMDLKAIKLLDAYIKQELR